MRDLGGNRKSLLLDESNDISILNVLRVTVICYCNNCEKVVSTNLDLTQIEKCDAENIFSAIMT